MFAKPPTERTPLELSIPDECPECGFRSFDVSVSFTGGDRESTARHTDHKRCVVVKCNACGNQTKRQVTDCRVGD